MSYPLAWRRHGATAPLVLMAGAHAGTGGSGLRRARSLQPPDRDVVIETSDTDDAGGSGGTRFPAPEAVN